MKMRNALGEDEANGNDDMMGWEGDVTSLPRHHRFLPFADLSVYKSTVFNLIRILFKYFSTFCFGKIRCMGCDSSDPFFTQC